MSLDGVGASPPHVSWSRIAVPMFFGGISLLCLVVSISFFIKIYQPNEGIQFGDDVSGNGKEASSAASASYVFVDIEGAVDRPGLYRLASGARVGDALVAAGGFLSGADEAAVSRTVNRAAKLEDGSKIYIPFLGEGASAGADNGVLQRVNINLASGDDLESLPGIGEVTAGKIIGGRPYLRLEELLEKKIVSASVFEKIKDMISL